MMREAQLGFFDTSCIEWAERGFPTDFVLWFAFESSAEVSDAAIVDQLQQRVEASPVLNRRLCRTPRHLDNPYWVYGIDEVGPLISVSPETGLSWDEVRMRIVDLLDDPLDLAVAPLRMRVYRNVTGLGPLADVVTVTMSHALMSGRSTGPLGEYLFAPRLLRWRIDGLPSAAVVFRPWRAAVRSARMVAQMSTAMVRTRRRRRRVRQGEVAAARAIVRPQWWAADFWGDGPRQVLETRQIPVPPKGEFRVTELWIAAISQALARFHADAGQSAEISVSVPVLVPFEDDMGANNVLLAQIPVDTAEGGQIDRLAKIRDELRKSRADLASADTAEVTKTAAGMPYLLQRRSIRKLPRHPRADVFVSSMSFRSDLDLQLAGQPWIAGGPLPSPRVAALSIIVWTFGDVIQLMVAAKPLEADAVRRLADMFVEEFDRVVAACAAEPQRG
ncbi:WS/DGAT domain-containing protein [Smaragdicoccus niigatensis]|uniref:WS/DGAT domain-containing protein n=1 Tax=Smaragdicoccus niigatensis TaxID=359359 RepID=UPI0003A979C3